MQISKHKYYTRVTVFWIVILKHCFKRQIWKKCSEITWGDFSKSKTLASESLKIKSSTSSRRSAKLTHLRLESTGGPALGWLSPTNSAPWWVELSMWKANWIKAPPLLWRFQSSALHRPNRHPKTTNYEYEWGAYSSPTKRSPDRLFINWINFI